MKKFRFTKETMIYTFFVAFIVLVSSCGFNGNQDNNRNQADTRDVAEERNDDKFNNNKQERDAEFLVNAAEMNMEQIQLGQLAQQNGVSTHVKELGKMMEDAHTKSLTDLTVLAKSKMISIPTSATNNSQDAYKSLTEKTGNDFDKEYADMMVEAHKDAIETFEDASTGSNDTEIKNWATAALPDLRAHLDHSIDCQNECNNSTNSNNSK